MHQSAVRHSGIFLSPAYISLAHSYRSPHPPSCWYHYSSCDCLHLSLSPSVFCAPTVTPLNTGASTDSVCFRCPGGILRLELNACPVPQTGQRVTVAEKYFDEEMTNSWGIRDGINAEAGLFAPLRLVETLTGFQMASSFFLGGGTNSIQQNI